MLDLEAKLFTLTADEYIHLPAVLVDFIRIYRNVRAEIRLNHGSSNQ